MSILEFEQLYEKYERELYAFIYSISRRDSYAAEDILQNTMINVYKYLPTLQERGKLRSWLFTIAKNEASRYYSKKQFTMEINYDDVEVATESNNIDYTEPDFSVELISIEDFITAVSDLNQEEQSIMYLRYEFGIKLNEMADMWNMNSNTVKTIHFRAIKKLKTMLIGKGYGFE